MSLLAVVLFASSYTADVVVTTKAKTTHSRIASNGTITRSESDSHSISYTDQSLKTMWLVAPNVQCLAVPIRSGASSDEVVGHETIDGHPTTEVKVTTKAAGKTYVEFQWRATDLDDLVIRRRAADGSFESHLEHIVVGTPDPKLLAFPSPPCKQDPSLRTSMPQAPGGERRIRFDQGACTSIVPLPISLQIPSDYEIRSAGAHGCFWGAEDDLNRVLGDPHGADFESIRRGVYWCRVSQNTAYDPVRKRFVSEMGDDSQWTKAIPNANIARGNVGAFPTLTMTATMNGQKAYMLYLAMPNTDSLAVLINYHPAGRGGAADDEAWSRFIKSLQSTR